MPPKKRSWGQIVDLTAKSSDDDRPKPPKRQTPTPSQQATQGPDYVDLTREYIDLTQEYVDLTQEDDGPPREFYCSFDGKIVGVRFYNGRASAGEVVLVQREPRNPYDPNAIQVLNVYGEQIGHLPRAVAAKLAPYMDRGEIAVEGRITGPKEFYDCPVRLFFFGPADPAQRPQIEESLKKDKLAKATQLKKTQREAEEKRRILGLRNGGSTAGFGDQAGAQEPEVSLEDILKTSESIDVRKDGDAIKTLAMGEDELAKMPEAPQPAQLKATLLPYQLQALAWMTAKENPVLPTKQTDPAVQLWKRSSSGGYYNTASEFATSRAPKLLSGGILADDMGLGKTLETISLILTGGPGTTLIVAPVSVMSNWQQQIQRHVLPNRQPKVLIYHGQKGSASELQKYDVVITSYGKLSQDPVFVETSRPWRRIVLDEGHTIRNAKTKVAQAACKIEAESRWILTGTPIINSVKDLQSLVRFLRIKGGIEQPEVFNAVITRRLGNDSGLAEALLQALMQDLCLRRKKDMKFIDLKLPEKKEFVHRISFKPEEKRKYDALLSEAKGALEEFQSRSNAETTGRFSNVLERLLRLRQVCNHWTLCRKRVDELLRLFEDEDVVELTEKNMGLLQEALKLYIEQQEDCAICYEHPSGPVITYCKHVFCRNCITKAIQFQGKCPMCRNQLDLEKLIEPAPEGFGDENFDADTQSSKTEALLHILRATMKKPGSKVIVFSQWTSFLNIVQSQLQEANIKFARIDGGMKADKRDQAIHALDNDGETRVMLASLAGGHQPSKTKLSTASTASGQTRETTVWRLVMENTVEDRVLQIQAGKRDLVNKAFQEKGKGKKAKDTRMADIQKLLS